MQNETDFVLFEYVVRLYFLSKLKIMKTATVVNLNNPQVDFKGTPRNIQPNK